LPGGTGARIIPDMPQITIYLDKQTAARVTASARREKLPVSKWIRRRIEHGDSHVWPVGYFERTYGCIKDPKFKRPAQGRLKPVESLIP
jgi:hypothetical protein